MKILKVAALLVAAVCLPLTGCSSASSSGSSGSASAGAGGKSYKIGIVEFSAADQTSQQAIAGYTTAAKKNGWSVTTIDPGGSTDKAIGAIQDMVQKKVDLIVVTVFPSTSLTAGLIAAKAANIPVISLSGGLADGVQLNYDSGTAQGKTLADELVKETGGKGDLLVLGYSSGLPCIGREKSLDAALKPTSITTTRNEVPIPGQVEASTQFTQAFLAKHPDLGAGLAVWGCFDDPALGAIAAIKQTGRTGIKVFGINGQPGAIKAIQDGDMDATVYLDVAAAGVDMAKRTPAVIKAGVSAKGEQAPVPSTLVTQSTIAQFVKDHPDALQGS